MLRRRSSGLSGWYSNKPKSTSPKSAIKPGRTLVLSSTASSTLDLTGGSDSPSPDYNPFTIDTSFATEPLFQDFFLPSEYTPQPPPSLPTLLEDYSPYDTSSNMPTVKFSMDLERNDFSSDDEDDILDSYCSTPPDTGLLATQVTIVYSGRAKMINIFPSHLYKQSPPPLPPQSVSRRSSSSTRDNSISLSSRSSDSDSRSSPASSISEYSNLVYETIPENKAFQPQPHQEVDNKPFRRAHRRNLSSYSGPLMGYTKQPPISIMELQHSSNSSLSKIDTAISQWEGHPTMSSFFSDSSSPEVDDHEDRHDYWH